MTSIVEFLAARYDEIEAAAVALNGDTWTHVPDTSATIVDQDGGTVMYNEGQPVEQDHHIALHDPAYELAVVKANRAILVQHPIQHSQVSDYSDCASCLDVDSYSSYPCRTVRLLALPFDSHPDYQESWRP